MMSPHVARIPFLLLVCAAGLLPVGPATAQLPSLPSTDEKAAADASAELAQLEKRRTELRERLSEWETMAAELTRAGQDAQARA